MKDHGSRLFQDRTDAGRQLARRLTPLRSEDVVVVGLPRGGVPVAFEVARELNAPLDVILVRKLGLPFQPEMAMGAIGEGGVRVLDPELIRLAGVSGVEVAEVEAREQAELDRRGALYRGNRSRIGLAGRVVVIVDDGIATGSTAQAACQVARAEGAARVIMAVPVAPSDWTARMGHLADELISLSTPDEFSGLGQFYVDFTQTSDDVVIACLDAASVLTGSNTAGHGGQDPAPRDIDVVISGVQGQLRGHLTVPEHAAGLVVFAHGSGSSRHSPRNRYVASVLNEAGLATLLVDLLTVEEEHHRVNVFDVDMLAGRLAEATRVVMDEPDLATLPVGYFGASTGAAAALIAAAQAVPVVGAVVSRGGRPDLAEAHLEFVRAPTLLIVGGSDHDVLELNKQAAARLRCVNDLTVVPGASHLFEEPSTLQTAAELARDWFVRHLCAAGGQQ